MAETIKSEVRKSVNAGSAVPLTDILYRTLHHWPWVLLSLVVCVGAAVVYLLCTPKVYTTTASIMIKDEAAPVYKCGTCTKKQCKKVIWVLPHAGVSSFCFSFKDMKIPYCTLCVRYWPCLDLGIPTWYVF